MTGDAHESSARRPIGPAAVYARTVSAPDGGLLPPERWQVLSEHLGAVAGRARQLGDKLGVAEWAWLAGMWHDLGKYHPDFQRMLHELARGRPKRRVDHSTAGAIHAWRVVRAALGEPARRRFEDLHLLLTATIAGHHAGLADGTAELEARLEEKAQLYDDVLAQSLEISLLKPTGRFPRLPARLVEATRDEWRLRLEFLVRMILSVLVDSDRLDAEHVTDAALPPESRRSPLRSGYTSIAELRAAVDRYIDRKVEALQPDVMSDAERAVYAYRQAVLGACREAFERSPGAFSLDVATGGGKTLSSLSFALRHAEHHGKQRVIVVIPYLSIIEQTAAEYRRALGSLADNILEHHSAADEGYERSDDTPTFDLAAERRRLATENWDAPLIVTTAVQFFESLFACTPSRCRKLHNVAKSVVVIDEAQMLPPHLLTPTVWAINELVEGYGTTVVLSTATQPALERPFPEVRNLEAIVSSHLRRPPRRVRVEILTGALEWPALAEQLASHPQVLCITHLRRDARELTLELDGMLGDETTVHLSASMCPAHRSRCITNIRGLLAEHCVCRVVSTQLVEAGVDLDFPVVYRSLAGVDSLVQAAGRANREGKLGVEGGLLRIFRAPTQPPPGLPRHAAESADTLFRATSLEGREVDPFAPETGRAFFRRYYEKIGDKDAGVTARRVEFRYREVAETYRFIRGGEITVAIPWDEEARGVLREIDRYGASRNRLRRIQPFTVSVFPNALRALFEAGAAIPLLGVEDDMGSGLFVLRRREFYDERFGLRVDDIGTPNPRDLVL